MPESFASFMARALHDPERGYYARRIRDVGGARGDFATVATLSPLLGQAVAAWLVECRRQQPEIRDVIEVGAGNGELMHRVRHSLGWWRRRGFRWHVMETSPVLRERQRQRLGRGVAWHEGLAPALERCGGAAWIYHNELLDAFPMRLAQWQACGWQEVFLETGQGRARELLEPLSMTDEQRGRFSALSWQPKAAGQRCELQEAVYDWLKTWLPAWRAGVMLTIDYGDFFPALYHRRPHGTLRAYFMHQRFEGAEIYERPGRQDITADINFTDYRAWLQDAGVEELWSGTQAQFITSRLPQATGAMVDSEGAGGAFKVFLHGRGRGSLPVREIKKPVNSY